MFILRTYLSLSMNRDQGCNSSLMGSEPFIKLASDIFMVMNLKNYILKGFYTNWKMIFNHINRKKNRESGEKFNTGSVWFLYYKSLGYIWN